MRSLGILEILLCLYINWVMKRKIEPLFLKDQLFSLFFPSKRCSVGGMELYFLLFGEVSEGLGEVEKGGAGR